MATIEEKKKWRARHPEKVKEMRRRYLDKKFRNNPELMDKLVGQLKSDFSTLTRIMYGDILPKECYICKSRENLQIHHFRYEFPILEKDIVRLCMKCHNLEHQKVTPLSCKE